jgi:hypothetical protein
MLPGPTVLNLMPRPTNSAGRLPAIFVTTALLSA